jgi:hypothetical protein
MIETIKKFATTHIFYLVLIAGGVIGFHSWLSEHDARLAADTQVKQLETEIPALKAQIATSDQAIKTLSDSMAAVSQAAQKQVIEIQTKAAEVKTPAQAISSLDSVSTVPLQAQSLPDAPDRASVLALPLFQELSQAAIDRVNLDACSKNLVSETKIANENDTKYQAEVKITATKVAEITALTKKPAFWKRVTGTLKPVGIGIGIGLAIAAHGL